MKIKSVLYICTLFIFIMFAGCVGQERDMSGDGSLRIVTTIYAPYDFVKQIAGDKVSVRMLLSPGEESHSFDPSPKDLIDINECDLFIYNGGENDEWVNDILESMDDVNTLKMMDCIDTLYKEEHEHGEHGHEGHTHEHSDEEYDEHVWTSPINAAAIVKSITEELCVLDENNAEVYTDNGQAYTERLYELDKMINEVVSEASGRTITFGDRFALRYFTEQYGLSYHAAFPGCAADNEVNPRTIASLIDTVKKENIGVILKAELGNGLVAESIARETGAKVETFYSCHNVSKEEYDRGFGYIDMMEHNAAVLREALN